LIPSWVRYSPDELLTAAYYSQPDAAWPDPDEPELPWAWHLADWLHKPAETAAAGYMQFRRPFAFAAFAADPLADKRWNLFPQVAMSYVSKADRLFRVPEEKRKKEAKKEADDLMTEIYEGLIP
jgi:hypothetical protein